MNNIKIQFAHQVTIIHFRRMVMVGKISADVSSKVSTMRSYNAETTSNIYIKLEEKVRISSYEENNK